MRVEHTRNSQQRSSLLRDERGALGVNWMVVTVGLILVCGAVIQGVGSVLEPGTSNVGDVIALGTSGEGAAPAEGATEEETWPENVPRLTPPRDSEGTDPRQNISANIGDIPGNRYFRDGDKWKYMSRGGLVTPASRDEQGRLHAEHVVFDDEGRPTVVVPDGYDAQTATIYEPGAQVDTVADELDPMRNMANEILGGLRNDNIFGAGAPTADVDHSLSADPEEGAEALGKLRGLYGDDATSGLEQALNELAENPNDPAANERALQEMWRMRQRTLEASLAGAGLSTDPAGGDPPSYEGQTVSPEAARAHVVALARAASLGADMNKVIEEIRSGDSPVGDIFKNLFQ